MIISVPPAYKKPEDESKEDATVETHDVKVDYKFQVVPADGARVGDEQYVHDPDEWFRSWCEWEDLIRIKRHQKF